jgi:hypothetical protein
MESCLDIIKECGNPKKLQNLVMMTGNKRISEGSRQILRRIYD